VAAFDNFKISPSVAGGSTIFSRTKAVTRYAGSRSASGFHHGFADSPVVLFRHPFGIQPQRSDY
jgi:hypothetical protein